MNYVFKKERGEIDAWVAEMDEVSMEKAIGEAAIAMKKKAAKRDLDEITQASKPAKTTLELKLELLEILKPTETISSAIRRISGMNSNKSNKGQAAIKRRRPAVETITKKCDLK
jgi:hypothetical protein